MFGRRRRKEVFVPSTLLRLLVILRIIALILTLAWRLVHPNKDALLLWGLSIACEFWFGLAWLLDQLPKLRPVKRKTDLKLLEEKFKIKEELYSDLPAIDIFVTTTDPDKEPPLTTANTILSILAADYPAERLSCYLSDDGASYFTYNVMFVVAKFSKLWVPFCRKHNIEPRNPDYYFSKKKDPLKGMVHPDFVQDYNLVKKKYDQFKVYINGLPQSELLSKENEEKYWSGAWSHSKVEGHSVQNHDAIVEVVLKPGKSDCKDISLEGVDTNLPILVYISREKRPNFDPNKKAGAMNALMRASAILSNGPFILNLDCDHYIYNSKAMKEAICFMLDRGGDGICYVQFPQRFDGIDPSDRYANKNAVFFDVIMRCHDGIQGPFYVGTGCVFRRVALYGIDPPKLKRYGPTFSDILTYRKTSTKEDEKYIKLCMKDDQDINKLESITFGKLTKEDDKFIELCTKDDQDINTLESIFGKSKPLIESFDNAEKEGLPLNDHLSVRNGRQPGMIAERDRIILDDDKIEEAKKAISCWFEDGTEWGKQRGWIYGSLTEDVVTGYTMHNRGWESVYCVPTPDAFRGTAPINLTDRLHQVLRWATGSVEIFFSHNNAFYASDKMKMLQRIAYINLATYPFTSILLTIYCYVPAISLFNNKYVVRDLSPTFLGLLLTITATLCLLALLEIKWSGISLEQYWRNQQFWLMSGTSAHLFAVLQGLLKVVCKLEIKFNVTSKSTHDEDDDDEFADLYVVKWSTLMIPLILIMVFNVLAIAVGFTRAAYSTTPIWGSLIGGVFFSVWVLSHLHPFILGLRGKGDMPGIIYIWSAIIAITISLLWVVKPTASDSQVILKV
ncbi:hypothetical protein RND81_02G070300 [Saponaria officinalis]|uniref:Uncharacterized protein n=1 Tax=Saponaria officinalis TaxID=3572 RepID=A0AAW1MWA9_SAPOF